MLPKKLIVFFFLAYSTNITAQSKPNIIYIMADDLGYADLSCYGRKGYSTPHLDKLASQGALLLNYYAAAPICTPSRTAFMTGRYPARTPVGLREPLVGSKWDSTIGLTSDQTSIATLMLRNGYETFLVGKWHLGFAPEHSPLRNGFNEFFGFHGGALDYISHNDSEGNDDLYDGDKPVVKKGYMTDLIAEKSIDIINRKHNKPIFLCVMFNAPHWPWQGPEDKEYPHEDGDWRKYGTPEKYAEMVKSLDSAVGDIMKAIDKQNLTNNTVVIFSSDNGGERFSDMGKYRGSKGVLLEGGIREPAMVRWPGKIPAGITIDQPAITMDWTVTILKLGGGRPDLNFPMDGVNLMPFLSSNITPVSRTFYWRVFQRHQQDAIRDGDWKYLKTEKEEYLFNISNDSEEKTDLKEKNPKIFEKLKREFRTWEQTVLKPVPLDE